MDQRTRKTMTMYKALNPRDDVDRLYVSRKEDLPALKTALTHRYNDPKTIYKHTIEDWLQPSEKVLKTRWTIELQQLVHTYTTHCS